MKKSILIICIVLATSSLTALGYITWNSQGAVESSSLETDVTCNKPVVKNNKKKVDLYYGVSTRFIATISKEDLRNAKSIADLVPKGATDGLDSFRDMKIVLHENKKFEVGEGINLNSAQIDLLKEADYSMDFNIEGYCKEKNPQTGEVKDYCFVYYVTVVPEKEAEYQGGKDALIKYLKESNKDKIGVIEQDKLKPGKVVFTVSKNGTIKNVKLASTSGFESVDESLIEIIIKMPKKWNPATNSKGEKIDQELVFFFGLQGC